MTPLLVGCMAKKIPENLDSEQKYKYRIPFKNNQN